MLSENQIESPERGEVSELQRAFAEGIAAATFGIDIIEEEE